MKVKKVTGVKFYAEKIAELIKVLDRREAGLLVFAFALYQDEVIEDLNLIQRAIKCSDFGSIFELLCWYRNKSLAETAKVSFRQPKKELQIFKRYSPISIA